MVTLASVDLMSAWLLNQFRSLAPANNHADSISVSAPLLAFLVEWLGKRHLAPFNNNSIRRNKEMILNGINEVSKETGIHQSSLRRWESLGFIAPGRISFGETWVRVYSDQDVELLKRAKRLMDGGYKLRAAFERVGNED